jgi:hypothetical protein
VNCDVRGPHVFGTLLAVEGQPEGTQCISHLTFEVCTTSIRALCRRMHAEVTRCQAWKDTGVPVTVGRWR